MKVESQCPECDRRFKVAEEHVGRKGRCPSCQAAFVITVAAESEPRPGKRKSDPAKGVVQPEKASAKKSRSQATASPNLPLIGTAVVLTGVALGSVIYFAMNRNKVEAETATTSSTTSPQTLVSSSTTPSDNTSPETATDVPAKEEITSPSVSTEQTAAVETATPASGPPAEAQQAVAPPAKSQTETVDSANTAPVEIVFPAKRKFDHKWPILDQRKTEEKLVIQTLVTRAPADDKDDTAVFVDLISQDPKSNPNGGALWETVQLRVESESGRWKKMKEQDLSIILDGDQQNIVVYPRSKEIELFGVMLPLADFQKMLNAQTIEIQVGPRSITLKGNHIEGMRDLASRATAGKTKDGHFVISLQPDPATATVAARPSRSDEEFPLDLRDRNLERKKNVLEQLIKILTLKEELKQARIADDAKAAAKATSQITEEQATLRQLIEAPLEMPELLPYRFSVEQVGRLPVSPLKVIQVFDRKKGEILVDFVSYKNAKEFIIKGIDASDLVDGNVLRIRRNLCFHVASIKDYKTVDGGTNSVYQLVAYPADFQISEADRKRYDEALNTEYKIELTAEEEAQAQKSKESNAQQNMDKEKLAKTRRSKSNLESAKLLLRKEEKAAAKKYLEKAVADDPESESGKEAAKLLEELF